MTQAATEPRRARVEVLHAPAGGAGHEERTPMRHLIVLAGAAGLVAALTPVAASAQASDRAARIAERAERAAERAAARQERILARLDQIDPTELAARLNERGARLADRYEALGLSPDSLRVDYAERLATVTADEVAVRLAAVEENYQTLIDLLNDTTREDRVVARLERADAEAIADSLSAFGEAALDRFDELGIDPNSVIYERAIALASVTSFDVEEKIEARINNVRVIADVIEDARDGGDAPEAEAPEMEPAE